jgi:hypothetical protein
VTEPSANVSFPHGVADPGASRAYVRDRSGTVMMLDLATGEVLWRAGRGLRPLALVDDVLVTARIIGPGGIEIVILDRADGAVRRVSKPLSLPVWARPSLDDSPEFALRAEIEGQSVIIRWSAQSRFRGGAPPSAQVRESYERDAQGVARVALDTGDIELLDEPIDSAPVSIGQTARYTAEPDVVEQQEIGDKFFQLVARSDTEDMVKVLVRAVERQSGKTLWETVIEETPLRRPKPLRP